MDKKKLQMAAKMGNTIKGTLPFDSKKPTITLEKKPEEPKKVYYKRSLT